MSSQDKLSSYEKKPLGEQLNPQKSRNLDDLEFDHKVIDHQLKVEYTQRIYNLMCCSVIGVFCFLVAEASLMAWHHPTLDSSVLIALAVTSTANIIGLFAIVTHHYFPKR